jgi:hypothetical protein
MDAIHGHSIATTNMAAYSPALGTSGEKTPISEKNYFPIIKQKHSNRKLAKLGSN